MLAERATQLDAEQESSSQPSIWREVYALMRCNNPSCALDPHCWPDLMIKKHYKLKTHHLRSLIRYVEQRGPLRSHDDVPEDIRQQLYIKKEQRHKGKHTDAVASPFSMFPINITNALSEQLHHNVSSESQVDTSGSRQASSSSSIHATLKIPGLHDVAVREYSNWQQSQIGDEVFKVKFHKACHVILIEGLDLEQVYKDCNPDFLIEKDVKRDIVRRFIADIIT